MAAMSWRWGGAARRRLLSDDRCGTSAAMHLSSVAAWFLGLSLSPLLTGGYAALCLAPAHVWVSKWSVDLFLTFTNDVCAVG